MDVKQHLTYYKRHKNFVHLMIKTHKGYHNSSGGHQAWYPESNPWRLTVKESTNSFKLPWPPQAHGGKQTYTKLSVWFFFLISVKRKINLKHNQGENNLMSLTFLQVEISNVCGRLLIIARKAFKVICHLTALLSGLPTASPR